MDRAISHFQPNLSQLLEKEKWKYCLIPPGLARFAQPLDISIIFFLELSSFTLIPGFLKEL